MIEITIPGKPIAKKRPKFARRGKFVTTYNPQESEEGKWITMAMTQINGQKIEGPVALSAFFYMPIPSSTSRKKCEAMLAGQIAHTKKPDCDNLIKFCLDCLNGVVWADDAQVTQMYAVKTYSDNPRTEIRIGQVQN